MATSKKTARQPWEELDDDLEAACSAVSPSESVNIDASLGLQMISIRLERELLGNLKFIAKQHGVGYQPLIRDLLNRFARSEMQLILRDQLSRIEKAESEQAPMEPIDEFLARQGDRKQA